jgi:Lanthionine synthetase C-like protein
MLYDPATFEPLTEERWDAGRARAAIREIVTDTDGAFDVDGLWPAEEWDGWQAPAPLLGLYVGAAGVIWALDALRRRGHAETRLDLAAATRRTLELWRERPDFQAGVELPSTPEAALLTGESGILLVAWRLAPEPELADDLHARVLENVPSEANELMWGSPGTMLAAQAMLDWTGEERWAAAWRVSADELWRRRGGDGVWTQQIYGQTFRALGPVHGAVGNVLALLDGELLDSERRGTLVRETAALVERTAIVEDGLANWPVVPDKDVPELRLQWCHGAPGMVVSAASYLDPELLVAGAELTWRAGPPGMEKGSGLCHGTAGNGYALLKAFERTGDELWLERARRFAVHALGQVQHGRELRGRGRYSFWTGDVGVALFAADCLDERAAYPIVDTWD